MPKWCVNHLTYLQLFSNEYVSLHLHILRTTFNVQNLQDKQEHTSPRKQNKHKAKPVRKFNTSFLTEDLNIQYT